MKSILKDHLLYNSDLYCQMTFIINSRTNYFILKRSKCKTNNNKNDINSN